MKINPFSRLKKMALFFITPLTYPHLKTWKFYTIYALIIAPSILITYNSINRYHSEYIRYERMNENIVRVYEKKKLKATSYTSQYEEFTQIMKHDDCLKYSSIDEPYKALNHSDEKYLQCIKKETVIQRVNNFISKNSRLLDSFYNPAITFKGLSAVSQKTIESPVKYSTSSPKTQELYTVLPVELKFNSTFKKALKLMQELSNECFSCQISIHKLNKTQARNYYDIVLMVRMNLDMQDTSDIKELSKKVSSGVYAGNNLADFVSREPHQI